MSNGGATKQGITAPTTFLSLAPVHSVSPRPTTRVFATKQPEKDAENPGENAAPAPEAAAAPAQQAKTARSGSDSSTGTAGSEFLMLGHKGWTAEGECALE